MLRSVSMAFQCSVRAASDPKWFKRCIKCINIGWRTELHFSICGMKPFEFLIIHWLVWWDFNGIQWNTKLPSVARSWCFSVWWRKSSDLLPKKQQFLSTMPPTFVLMEKVEYSWSEAPSLISFVPITPTCIPDFVWKTNAGLDHCKNLFHGLFRQYLYSACVHKHVCVRVCV